VYKLHTIDFHVVSLLRRESKSRSLLYLTIRRNFYSGYFYCNTSIIEMAKRTERRRACVPRRNN